MHSVIVSVNTTVQQFPAETVAAGIEITLGTSTVFVRQAPYKATFDNVVAGEYVVTATAKDIDGLAIGAVVTASVTIAPDVVNIDVPSSISIEVI